MSGGRYGPGKAPERACMPLTAWPAMDRQRWMDALTPADILADDVGSRAAHSAQSNFKTERGYGRWLTYCAFHEQGALELLPAERLTSERVRRYLQHLKDLGNSTRTQLCRLQELEDAAKAIAHQPEGWRFLRRFGSQIRSRHVPARSKSRIVLSDELAQLAADLLDEAGRLTGVEAAGQFRDGLMVLFLAYVPIRRKNFARLMVGQHLLRERGRWRLELSAADTKTHSCFEVQLPSELGLRIDEYLERYRPLLVARTGRWHSPAGDCIWVSRHGSPLSEMAIYDRLRKLTDARFGVGMGPHLFRDAAASTLATEAPEHVRAAAPVLGHRNFRTTETYYRQAKMQRAHARYVAALFDEPEGNAR